MDNSELSDTIQRWNSTTSLDSTAFTYKDLLQFKPSPKKPDLNTLRLSEDSPEYTDAVAGVETVSNTPPQEVRLHLDRNKKTGKFIAGINNLFDALSTSQFSRMYLGYDIFKDKCMFTVEGETEWREVTNEVYTEIKYMLHRLNFAEISTANIKEAVRFVAICNRFDSAIEWLNGLVWDKIPRVESFNSVYFGTEDTTYTRAVGRYTWSAMAARILDGGCKCDMSPIYLSDQGDGKSTAIQALAPRREMATDISFMDDEDKSIRKLKGTLVGELCELKGLLNKDAESTKAFLTRTHDRIRPLYSEYTIDIPRRCMFIGSTNNPEFLGDPTGERRWLPMKSDWVDVEAIITDRNQLWAEAAVIYKEHGMCWQDAERLAANEHYQYKIEDLWQPTIEAYISLVTNNNSAAVSMTNSPHAVCTITTPGILKGALEIDVRNQSGSAGMRVSNIMIQLGYEKQRIATPTGIRQVCWVKIDEAHTARLKKLKLERQRKSRKSKK
jgi:predicted P-loop ATPase